jgi:hypothetical protein
MLSPGTHAGDVKDQAVPDVLLHPKAGVQCVAVLSSPRPTGAGWGVSGDAENMAIHLTGSTTITGMITASRALHYDPATSSYVTTISSSNYYDLGEVINTPQASINNGAIVSVDGTSTWTVTGTSYLTKLILASGATLTAPSGKTVTMTVGGTTTAITSGKTYTGAIVLTVQ